MQESVLKKYVFNFHMDMRNVIVGANQNCNQRTRCQEAPNGEITNTNNCEDSCAFRPDGSRLCWRGKHTRFEHPLIIG